MAISSSPSTSSALSSFNIDGVSSGLKTADIIDKLMSLQKGSLNQLTNQQTQTQARDDAYQLIDAQMLNLQTALNKLRIPSNVNAKAVTSGTSSVATATANSGAVNGSYALNVTRLATATSVTGSILRSGAWISAPVGAGFKDGTEPGSPTLLANAGFSTRPTAGSFTINGVKITIDPTTQSLNDVISAINTSGAGVTASVGTDANGNKNFLTLHSTATPAQPIQLGAGSDTSNFLGAARLVSTGAAGDITSAVPLAAVGTGTTLSNLNFSRPLTASSGSFSINGKQISWNVATDTLSSILGKINSAGAGVNAIYDPNTDAVTLTNIATGSQSIDLNPAQDAGGLLAALHLDGGAAQQKVGQTAQYSVNGGPPQYSNSNTLAGVVAGVTINVASTGTTSLTVAQDPQTTISNVQSFATAYNTLVDTIDKYTAYDNSTRKAALLTGDSGLQTLQSQLRRMLASSVSGLQGQYTSLGSIGISTGTFGSAVGTTNHLSVDTDKLTAALNRDSASVLAVLVGDRRATLNAGPNGAARPGAWVSSVSGAPTDPTHGRYQVTVDSAGNLKAVFTPIAGAAQSPVSGTISAFSSNTTLIPGMSISVGALPASGSATDSIAVGQTGVLSNLSDYVSSTLGKSGLFDTQHTAANSQLKVLADKITTANSQITLKQRTLQAQFTAMEVALTKLQSQGSQLTSTVNGWNGKSS